MIGRLAFSKAGHDKGTVYIIIGEDAENVYVCDGELKPVERPKKKNKRHIQPIYKGCDEDLRERLKNKQPVRNEEIKRAIKVFIMQGGNRCQKQM
ncbi:MAG: KOW domain-containing RNA-binding protein [Lachnospiraceae bacterium]|nr:KOW domain-containing RNA-binding protein [Lachnospiraceae bacterium]MBQ7781475.1 KOW domain-containing RNA-binding protein [Lachnospiraceae bacterium]